MAKKKRRKSGSRVSASLKRVAERALYATEFEITSYMPRDSDICIAEAMLAGACTQKEIAESSGIEEHLVGDILKDPVVCAWISRRVHENIAHRLGLIDAAMMRRALAGDVAAARLLLDRYGHLTSKSMHLNISASADLEKMTDADLDAMLKTQLKTAKKAAKEVDYVPKEEQARETCPESPGGGDGDFEETGPIHPGGVAGPGPAGGGEGDRDGGGPDKSGA